MLVQISRPNTVQDKPNQLPGTLAALEAQLERIRQEQLAKNRSSLRSLAAEQQRSVELLTQAITRKIFDNVMQEWKLSTAQGRETQITEIIGLIWGSREKPVTIPGAKSL